MRPGNRYMAHTTGNMVRYSGQIGAQGLYQLFLLGGGLLGLMIALRFISGIIVKPIFIVFRVLYSWLGFSGSYGALVHEAGPILALGLFLLPFVGFLAWSWAFRIRRKAFRRRVAFAALACALAGWSSQVPSQTAAAFSNFSAKPVPVLGPMKVRPR